MICNLRVSGRISVSVVRFLRFIACMIFLLPAAVAAQGPPPRMAERYKPQRMEMYVAHCALWRTDASFRSTIRISNQLASEIDAIPTIYMADGTAWDLPAVHLAKSGVETVDINAALATAPERVRAHLSTYGSAAIRYRYDWQGAVYASMAILDSSRSLEYNYWFVFPPGQGSGEKHLTKELRALRDAASGRKYEGLWFRNSRNAGGFLAVSNTSAKVLPVQVTLSGLQNPAERTLSLPAHSTALLNLTDLFGGDESRTGGITVTHGGPEGALQVAGGVEDFSTGYSAPLPIVAVKSKSGDIAERQYASVGMMVNEQDTALGFPSGVKFWPYAFFRNLAGSSRTLHFSAYYMAGSRQVQRILLPDVTLEPGEAKELAIHDLMKRFSEIPDINLVFTYSGAWGDILEATGSTDTSGNYVFPVLAEPVARSGPKRSVYWLFGGGYDTMYTVWNPLDVPQDLLATLYYGSAGETYKIPLYLDAHASAMIDIGELVRNRQSDPEGKIIPLDVQQGSLELSGTVGEPGDFITVALSGGIYNPRKATCGLSCTTCSGLTDAGIIPNSFGVFVNGTQQLQFHYTIANSSEHDVTASSSWQSSAESIATVQTTGGTYPGLATGISPGQANIHTLLQSTFPANAGQICSGLGFPICPTFSQIEGTSSGNVKPTIDGSHTVWWFNGVSPAGYDTQITLTTTGGANSTWSVLSGASSISLWDNRRLNCSVCTREKHGKRRFSEGHVC